MRFEVDGARSFVALGFALWLATIACCTDGPPTVDPKLEEAVRWYTGVAGHVDAERAKSLLLEAAADEDVISRMWVARVYSRGRMGFERDEERAHSIARDVIDRIEAAANSEIAEAVFLMGTAYAEGLGRPMDAVEAARWYHRSARLGNGLAQHNLGNIYYSGTGVPRNDSTAVFWWRRAAEGGDAVPQLRLGMMYEQGRGVRADLEEARRWYTDAARRGNDEARDALKRLDRERSGAP